MDKSNLTVRDFRKIYGDFVAVDGISFDVQHGEIFGLFGPNGAGKTTALESLEGILTPDGGTLKVANVDPSREPRKLRNLIGVQLQSSGLPDSITPVKAMKLFCAYHAVAQRFDLLERLGLAEKRRAQFYELSTGQQRRLALALAIAHNPQVLFLDEPTAGLDVPTRVELHDLLRELQANGTTTILATHDIADIISQIENRGDTLIDLRVERPSQLHSAWPSSAGAVVFSALCGWDIRGVSSLSRMN